MAHTVENRIETPAAELRDLLDRAERQLPALDATALVDYLVRLDRIDALFAELQDDSRGGESAQRAEEGRWVDLQQQIERRSPQLVKLAAQVGGYGALRQQHQGSKGFWWRLDERVAAHRRRRATRMLVSGAVAVLVLAVAALAYQRWLAPDEATLALVQALNTIEQNVDGKSFEPALIIAEESLATMPGDPELLAWAAVLSERLGRSESAAEYGERTLRALGGNELNYHLLIGTHRFRTGDHEGATGAADQASLLDPDEPQVHFLYGNIAEARGDINAALDAFDRAATLAEADNPQLAVVSKMRYGFLLQQLQMAPGAGMASPDAAGAVEMTPLPTPSP